MSEEKKEKTKINFKDLFTKENLKKGFLWFFKSFIWLAILLFAIDLTTKLCTVHYLDLGESKTFIPGLLQFTYVRNKGAAWGAGDGAMWSRVLLVCISWIAAAVIIYCLWKYWKKMNLWYRSTLMCILAGDVGNLIDRTFYFNDGVIDMLDISPLFKFPVFNFADCCLVVGIIVLMILFIVDMVKEEIAKNKKLKTFEASAKENQNKLIEDQKELQVEENIEEKSESDGEK